MFTLWTTSRAVKNPLKCKTFIAIILRWSLVEIFDRLAKAHVR